MTTTAHRQIAAFDAVSTVRRDIRRLLSGTAHVLSRIAWITVLALGALSSTNSLAVKAAEPGVFPAGFRTEDIQTDGATIHVRVGGAGPALLAIHGFGDTGDMWAPLAQALMAQYTIIAPDLRGMGLSSHPPGGYDKKTQAADLARVLDALNVREVDLVTHDIGNMVGYAFAAQYPDRVKHYVAMDAPLPGIGPWDEQLRNPKVWHFNFRGPDVERLVQGRERIYLDRFWNELSANPAAIDEATRQHYASFYALPGAMHSAFEQFAAFPQDARDNQAFLARGKLTIPVLAIGGEKSYGPAMAADMRFVAVNVKEGVVTNAGHWLMEEQPAQTIALIRDFLAAK
jgi:pimeloyl-ACP methyl ester carboxylesterase